MKEEEEGGEQTTTRSTEHSITQQASSSYIPILDIRLRLLLSILVIRFRYPASTSTKSLRRKSEGKRKKSGIKWELVSRTKAIRSEEKPTGSKENTKSNRKRTGSGEE